MLIEVPLIGVCSSCSSISWTDDCRHIMFKMKNQTVRSKCVKINLTCMILCMDVVNNSTICNVKIWRGINIHCSILSVLPRHRSLEPLWYFLLQLDICTKIKKFNFLFFKIKKSSVLILIQISIVSHIVHRGTQI